MKGRCRCCLNRRRPVNFGLDLSPTRVVAAMSQFQQTLVTFEELESSAADVRGGVIVDPFVIFRIVAVTASTAGGHASPAGNGSREGGKGGRTEGLEITATEASSCCC